ncbi:vacuolar protein sorting-associated protein 24-like protein 1-like isoform X1 [Gossypium australe]|uniref:Vacuolar protein sorting-associated protein 24-like protein 1-like isoform X1 n=1 Tax=Gossypium australe TaxID=47621 RepID=A0A5B6WJV7_9ROSI|nr:vacuolar protein sorting-associated protein 24-like protein 1-like isoform X1 [Gossypium australe]
MDKFKNMLKPKPNPQQLLRDWQRKLRQECHVQREEKGVQKAIREAAKRNDMGSAKALAKEIVMSRKAVNRLYENKAQLNSISMHLGESVAIARTVGHLSKSAEVMKLVNNLMKAPQMAATMQEFSKEMIKAGVIEEMLPEAVRKERVRVSAEKESTSREEEAIAEGADDEEELEEIRARLARVRFDVCKLEHGSG